MRQTTYIAYICPSCGVVLTYEVNLMALVNGIETKCRCGGSELTINFNKVTKKIQLSVPCMACPNPHPYNISCDDFFSEELLMLPCTFSGMDICFIGEREKIMREIQRTVQELEEMLRAEYELDDEDGCECGDDCHCHGDDCDCHSHDEPKELPYYDVLAMSGVLRILKEMMEEGRVSCECGADISDIGMTLSYDSIVLSCKDCQAQTVISAKTDGDIIRIAETDRIILK